MVLTEALRKEAPSLAGGQRRGQEFLLEVGKAQSLTAKGYNETRKWGGGLGVAEEEKRGRIGQQGDPRRQARPLPRPQLQKSNPSSEE